MNPQETCNRKLSRPLSHRMKAGGGGGGGGRGVLKQYVKG